MRTFMMDELGTICQDAGTTDAAEEARATLETKGSADEWAVAMRNLAQADPDGSKSFLAAKARELIEYARRGKPRRAAVTWKRSMSRPTPAIRRSSTIWPRCRRAADGGGARRSDRACSG